jgi:TPR repeat protein
MALAHLSFIQLYDSTIYDEQRFTALKTLKKLAKQNCPEACLILGNLYQPGAPALPHSFQITQSKKTAQTYFSQIGVTYSDTPVSESSWFPCTIL